MTRASVRRLGTDLAEQIGPRRQEELRRRWVDVEDEFSREFRVVAQPEWTGSRQRRRELIDALTRGLNSDLT